MSDQLFEDVLTLAMGLGGPGHGMASIRISWHPYLCKWQAEANWSDGTRIVSDDSDSPTDAICDLKSLLREEQNAPTIYRTEE